MTGQEVTPPPLQDLVPHPRTGEVVNLRDAPTDVLAELALAALERAREIRDLGAEAEAELRRRMDRAGTWTHRVPDPLGRGSIEVTAPSPTAGTETYADAKGLREDLLRLADAGVIDPAAVDVATSVKHPAPVYTALKGGVDRLRKTGIPAVVEVLDRHRVTATPDRKVKVRLR